MENTFIVMGMQLSTIQMVFLVTGVISSVTSIFATIFYSMLHGYAKGQTEQEQIVDIIKGLR